MLFLIHLSLMLLGSFVSSQPIQQQQNKKYMCLDSNYESFINKDMKTHEWVPCNMEDNVLSKADKDHLSYLRFLSITDQQILPTSAPIEISFKCFHAPKNVCEKAERAFKKAGDMISSVILFREPIKVNATLASFCKMGDECGKNMMTLGGSSPARAMPLLNDDGLVRLHPQALVKQYMLQDHLPFAEYDILSVFNADAPFWFEVNFYSN